MRRQRTRHPAVSLDDTVHQRVRLGILAVLRETDAADFGYLREILELTDGNLNRHLDVLIRAGYVTTAKAALGGGRSRTIATITTAGTQAFDAELRTIEQLARRGDRGRAGAGDGS